MRFSRICAISLAILLTAAAASAESARGDTVLQWDDGVMDRWLSFGPYYLTKVAVRFDAPEWATHVTELQYYVCGREDGGPATFVAQVWRRTPDGLGAPGDPVSEPVHVEISGSHGRWVSVPLPVPVSIVPPIQFPEGRFYGGFEWLDVDAPDVGMDDTEPWDGETWFFRYPTEWVPIDGDAMIRAVVTDEYVSPVEETSWARIKCLML